MTRIVQLLVPRQGRTFIIDGSRFVARCPYPRGFIGHRTHSASSPRGDSNTNSTSSHHKRSPPHGQTFLSQWFQDPGSPPERTNPDPCRLVSSARFLRGLVLPFESGITPSSTHRFERLPDTPIPPPFLRLAPGDKITETNSGKFDAPTVPHQLPLRNSPLSMIDGEGGSTWDDNGYRVPSFAGFYEKPSTGMLVIASPNNHRTVSQISMDDSPTQTEPHGR